MRYGLLRNNGKSYPVVSEGTTVNVGMMVVLIWGTARPRHHVLHPLLIRNRTTGLFGYVGSTRLVVTCIYAWINIVWNFKASGTSYWI
jgi:hypothetical protein